jgi:hypothetical protein
MIDSSTWIEIVASHDNGAYYTDELLRVHQSSDAPQLVPSGRNVIWLDMSGGDYATLKLVTGD